MHSSLPAKKYYTSTFPVTYISCNTPLVSILRKNERSSLGCYFLFQYIYLQPDEADLFLCSELQFLLLNAVSDGILSLHSSLISQLTL